MNEAGGLQEILSNGRTAIVVECLPPTGPDVEAVRRAAAALRGKVDAVGVSDNRGEVRMSAVAAAALFRAEGIDPIVHMVTRDRNRIALMSDVYGARALGLDNVLCTSGDHQALGSERGARNVFDYDSVQLIATLDELRREGERSGNGRSDLARLYLGSVASPQADPPEMQAIRLAKKVKAGANFIVTQPVFEAESLTRWLESLAPWGIVGRVPILVSLLLPLTAAGARAIAEKMPGVRMPESILARFESADDTRDEAIRLAVELVGRIKGLRGIKGFYIMAENDVDAALRVIERSGLKAHG